jgi:hypothetical protein
MSVKQAMNRLIQEVGIRTALEWPAEHPAPRWVLSISSKEIERQKVFERQAVRPAATQAAPATYPPGFEPWFAGDLVASLFDLAAAIQRPDAIERCENCRTEIARWDGRRLRSDGAHYCDNCRPEADKLAARQRKRDQYAASKSKLGSDPRPRICQRFDCFNPLPTTHSRRKFCSDTCRGRYLRIGSSHVRVPQCVPQRSRAQTNQREPKVIRAHDLTPGMHHREPAQTIVLSFYKQQVRSSSLLVGSEKTAQRSHLLAGTVANHLRPFGVDRSCDRNLSRTVRKPPLFETLQL